MNQATITTLFSNSISFDFNTLTGNWLSNGKLTAHIAHFLSNNPLGGDMKDSTRTTKGQFTKGTSGNSAGRPAGSWNKATLACEQLLADDGEQLIRKAVEM